MRALPGIRDVAVTAVPDKEWGQRVVAAVVLQPSASSTPEQLIAATRTHLAGYKTPKQIDIVTEMPLTLNGKPDRKKVRAAFMDTKQGDQQ
jgi:fatty-acyl-CoA synthase